MLLQVIRETQCYIGHESGVNVYTLVEGDIAVAIGPPRRRIKSVLARHNALRHRRRLHV